MIFAQNVSDDLQRANKQFDLYAYNLALQTYKQVLEKDPNNGQALTGVAECYFQLNKVDESLPWYERAVEHRTPNSDIQFRYGRALMLKGNYELAKRQFLEYAALNELTQTAGRHYAEMCDYAVKTAKQAPLYTAKNEALNTEASDFGATFLGNRVVYSSARTDIVRKTKSKSSSDWSGSAYNQLFVTQRNPENGALQKPTFLRSDLQNSYNESPVSFSADGKKVAFCRNNFINGTRQTATRGLDMSLYTADVVDGEWVNVKPFPYNGSDYATGMPCLSPDGRTLVFASNNPSSATGGKGWDIYVSNLVNGEWSTPRNLGAPLNTPGNEVTPFYDGEHLYFSSDWHSGLGGLDIFRADLGKNEVKNVYHLGPGVNSSYDDYCFVYNAQQNIGYITSNRPGGRGFEDIWQVVKTGNANTMTSVNTAPARSLAGAMTGRSSAQTNSDGDVITPSTYSDVSAKDHYITVSDSWGRPLPGVTVDMAECNGLKGETDTEGRVYFASQNRPYDCALDLSKDGYEPTRVDIKEFGAHNITVSIGTDSRQEFTGKVLDANSGQPLRDAVVSFTDKGRTVQIFTDNQGTYSLMLTPRSTYNIEYSHEGYKVKSVNTRPGMPGTGSAIPDVRLESSTFNSNSAASRSFAPPTSSQPAASSNTGDRPQTYTYTPPTTSGNQGLQSGGTYTYTPPSSSQPAQSNSNSSRPATTTIVPAKPQAEFNGYSVQLSALPANVQEKNPSKFEPLSTYGNIYTKEEDGKSKVRLGIFPTKSEAQKVLKEVNKEPQFKGAFVVEEHGADNNLVMGKKPAASNTAPAQYSATTSTARSSLAAPTTSAAIQNNQILYAVQLGSFATNKPLSLSKFSSLSNLGNIYSKTENDALKVRLGIWSNHADAEAAQAEVVKRGMKDAIIVTEKALDESIKDFLVADESAPAPASSAPSTYTYSPPTGGGQGITKSATTTAQPAADDGSIYYVRVCALADATRFNAAQLEGAGVSGKMEKWPVGNGTLTAVVLTGYTSAEAAVSDKDKLRNSGFPDAYVVKSKNGTITRVK
jgi:hypothetical protein